MKYELPGYRTVEIDTSDYEEVLKQLEKLNIMNTDDMTHQELGEHKAKIVELMIERDLIKDRIDKAFDFVLKMQMTPFERWLGTKSAMVLLIVLGIPLLLGMWKLTH